MSDPKREDEAAARARRGRNIAIAVGLVAFAVIVYVVTIVRLGANVADRF
ncbi:hypothetical protein [Phenylobacterium sp. SCN 70-31]|nr:hypothetical protein [Phenylobacterium sp. SCN 70-31]